MRLLSYSPFFPEDGTPLVPWGDFSIQPEKLLGLVFLIFWPHSFPVSSMSQSRESACLNLHLILLLLKSSSCIWSSLCVLPFHLTNPSHSTSTHTITTWNNLTILSCTWLSSSILSSLSPGRAVLSSVHWWGLLHFSLLSLFVSRCCLPLNHLDHLHPLLGCLWTHRTELGLLRVNGQSQKSFYFSEIHSSAPANYFPLSLLGKGPFQGSQYAVVW